MEASANGLCFPLWYLCSENFTFLQLTKTKRWKILYVSHLFPSDSFRIRSGETERHTETFETELATLMETRNGTSDDFTNLILTGGPTGVTGDSSPSPSANQYLESGHYTAFSFSLFYALFWNACTINMLLFFICWLYLKPSLLFPLPEQRGSFSHHQTWISFLFLVGCENFFK